MWKFFVGMSTKTDAPRLTWELLVSRQAGGWGVFLAVIPLNIHVSGIPETWKSIPYELNKMFSKDGCWEPETRLPEMS